VLDARLQPGARHTLDVTLQHQVLAAGRVAVDAGALRDVADRAPNGVRLAHDVVARDLGPPTVGGRERGEDLDGRRFAGAVRPEQAEDLAGTNGERDAVERLDVLVALLEPFRDDRVHGG
jgi:hypothetical protein